MKTFITILAYASAVILVLALLVDSNKQEYQTLRASSYSYSYEDSSPSRELRRGGGGRSSSRSSSTSSTRYAAGGYMGTGVLFGGVAMAYMHNYSRHYYGDSEDMSCLPDDEECITASKERAYFTVGLLAGSCLLTLIISAACCYCKYKRDMENEKRDAGCA